MYAIGDIIKFNNSKSEKIGEIISINDDNNTYKIKLFVTKSSKYIPNNEKYNILENEIIESDLELTTTQNNITEKISVTYIDKDSEIKGLNFEQYFCRFKLINDNTKIERINSKAYDNDNFISLEKRDNNTNFSLIDDIINSQKEIYYNKPIQKITVPNKTVNISNYNISENKELGPNDNKLLLKFKGEFKKDKSDSDIQRQRYKVRYKLFELFLNCFINIKNNNQELYDKYFSIHKDSYIFLKDFTIDFEGEFYNLNKLEGHKISEYITKCKSVY